MVTVSKETEHVKLANVLVAHVREVAAAEFVRPDSLPADKHRCKMVWERCNHIYSQILERSDYNVASVLAFFT